MFKLFIHKYFILNFFISLLVIYFLFWGIVSSLKWYTNHGETVQVPNLRGMKIEEIVSLLESHDLEYEVIDSVFENTFPKGTIVEQSPEPNSLVKHNRKIYLTVNALSVQLVELPELEDVSYMEAEARLKTNGLRVGQTIQQPADCEGCVLQLRWNGKTMGTGSKVPKNSKIDLIIGQTGTRSMVQLPNLTGMSLSEAESVLSSQMLSLHLIMMDSCASAYDSSSAVISKQSPSLDESAQIRQGGIISVWATCK